jgi:pimeloyl-ACP methyl ester carboxylesterase
MPATEPVAWSSDAEYHHAETIMHWKTIDAFAGVVLSCACAFAQSPTSDTTNPARAKSAVKYGSNPAVGSTFMHDGVELYYETYGEGEPLLLIHGNGESIGTFAAQIDYFRKEYKVIAMDSRDQGRSGDSTGKITYEEMADDQAALLDHLHSGPAYVLGWSDGGIEALLLGIRHPEKVKKIAAMAANLDPGEDAVYPEIWNWAKSQLSSIPAQEKETPQGKRELKVTTMLFEEPHIDPGTLEAITAPTLVLASDHDVIRDEHTLVIYHHIPNSQLCIFPDATHMIPYDDPVRFNTTVDRFFRTPFAKKDRLQDFVKSVEKMRAESGSQ